MKSFRRNISLRQGKDSGESPFYAADGTAHIQAELDALAKRGGDGWNWRADAMISKNLL